MPGRLLVTGVSGFAGRHLLTHLAGLSERPAIVGVDVTEAAPAGCDDFRRLDLASPEQASHVVAASRPDAVVHLAGTFGAGDTERLYRANVLPLAHLLEAVRMHAPRAIVVTVGSSAEYGATEPTRLPLTEDVACRPLTAYGLSKRLATEVALFHHRTHATRVTVVRPFQLIGRGISTRLVPGAFAKQLRTAVENGAPAITVRDLEGVRDFVDVRDACDAIWTLCTRPAPGEIFNICTGRATRVGELLRLMISASGAHVAVQPDAAPRRDAEKIPAMVGSFDKLEAHCGWRPHIGLADSVAYTLAP